MDKVVICLRVDEELKKALDMLALEDNRSLNNYIATILMKHVEDKNKEKENQTVLQS